MADLPVMALLLSYRSRVLSGGPLAWSMPAMPSKGTMNGRRFTWNAPKS
jgi:hypothetical protein